ncbi:uncharacterized protein LOC114296709 [Camellia sinensis]|uniref:uncharacterized protein LOC114296709 n=1 Tax=Camellia sinensis TaxID=4442 RepID=UPI001036B294|nr:uncharacterized protein LOC114296709 [Camellia sinensis]
MWLKAKPLPALGRAGPVCDQDAITVFACPEEERIIIFVFEDTGTHEITLGEINIPDIPANYLAFSESECEYGVVVGMPSEEFRRIMRHLRDSGSYKINVTRAEVETLTAGPDKNGDCIIWGVETSLIICELNLICMDEYIEASELTTGLIWIFKSSYWPDMLNFPMGSPGYNVLSDVVFAVSCGRGVNCPHPMVSCPRPVTSLSF